MDRRAWILAVFCLIGCGCQGGSGSGNARDLVALPPGDPEAGRLVFLSHGCALCHRASGEGAMPSPTSANLGPELGDAQAGWSARQLVSAIVEPSHRPGPTGGNAGGPPQMMEYADDLTVRELADLLAYLRYLME